MFYVCLALHNLNKSRRMGNQRGSVAEINDISTEDQRQEREGLTGLCTMGLTFHVC